MENSNKIIPPHLNAEVYRSDTTGTSTTSYLDYINIHPDGSVLVGCSELTGRYWNGGAMILSSLDNVKHCKKNIDLTNGSADGCFLWDSKKVLLCEDSGAVSIWSTSEDAWSLWTEVVSVAEHDNVALAVDCLDSGKEYVTVGADGNAKVWDINEMLCVRNYSAAHTREICGVSVRPKSTTSFVTGSLDRYITMWDDHTDKPVDLWNNNCGVRCLQWLDENKLVFGDDAGVLSVVDVRNTESVQKLAEYPAPIHRIVKQNGSDKVAVCCDNKIVTVCQILEDGQQSKVIYSNKDAHSNYVRGAAWDVRDPDILHTLGWDGEIKAHKINN